MTYTMGHKNGEAFLRWKDRRKASPRDYSAQAMADILYLIETGRLEADIEGGIDALIHAPLDGHKIRKTTKEAIREDGHTVLDSRHGIWEG